MDLAAFVHDLRHDGRVTLADTQRPDCADLDEEIAALDAALRLHAPGAAPPLDPAAATWAAARLYEACVFSKERNTPAAEVEAILTERAPFPADARTTWSVDVFFRCLPDLARLTRALPETDPLRVSLQALARDWPLSGIGVFDFAPPDPIPTWIEADGCLRHLWRERTRGSAASAL